jgi:hypothetical protein
MEFLFTPCYFLHDRTLCERAYRSSGEGVKFVPREVLGRYEGTTIGRMSPLGTEGTRGKCWY